MLQKSCHTKEYVIIFHLSVFILFEGERKQYRLGESVRDSLHVNLLPKDLQYPGLGLLGGWNRYSKYLTKTLMMFLSLTLH